jgi:DNA-binding HxlR family transcriptional regulator
MEHIEEDRQRAEVFDALGHPTRIIILKALNEGTMGFAELKKRVNIESSGHLQHHLNKLDGLIKTDGNGKYCLSDQGKDALLAMQAVENVAGLGLKKNGKRTAILWAVTGLISGSFIALLTDIVKQNPWFLLYIGLVLGWVWVLTGITSVYVRAGNKK